MLNLLAARKTVIRSQSRQRRCCTWIFVVASAGTSRNCSSSAFNFRFEKNRNRSTGTAPTNLQLDLLDRAAQVRESLGLNQNSPPSNAKDSDQLERLLFFDSSYISNDHERGFCNWIIPGRLMVGQYPGQTPEVHGPTEEEVTRHMERITTPRGLDGAHVRLFCSLQSEIPAQDDHEAWNRQDGMIFLEPEHVRRQFPRPFTHYAPVAEELCCQSSSIQHAPPQFIHSPIEDLNVPESQELLQELLLQ